MKISFDFDSSLTESKIQSLCLLLIKAGADVWILTSRNEKVERYGDFVNGNERLFSVAEDLNIPREKILFTNEKLKKDLYFEHEFDMHFDDMEDEVWEINRHGGMALLIGMDIGQLKYLFLQADRKRTIYKEGDDEFDYNKISI